MTRDWTDPDEPEAFVNSSRARHDTYGNPTLLLDPLATAPNEGVVVKDAVTFNARTSVSQVLNPHYSTIAGDSNTIETTDARNQRITYTYDGVNRVLTQDYHDEEDLISSHVFIQWK